MFHFNAVVGNTGFQQCVMGFALRNEAIVIIDQHPAAIMFKASGC